MQRAGRSARCLGSWIKERSPTASLFAVGNIPGDRETFGRLRGHLRERLHQRRRDVLHAPVAVRLRIEEGLQFGIRLFGVVREVVVVGATFAGSTGLRTRRESSEPVTTGPDRVRRPSGNVPALRRTRPRFAPGSRRARGRGSRSACSSRLLLSGSRLTGWPTMSSNRAKHFRRWSEMRKCLTRLARVFGMPRLSTTNGSSRPWAQSQRLRRYVRSVTDRCQMTEMRCARRGGANARSSASRVAASRRKSAARRFSRTCGDWLDCGIAMVLPSRMVQASARAAGSTPAECAMSISFRLRSNGPSPSGEYAITATWLSRQSAARRHSMPRSSRL